MILQGMLLIDPDERPVPGWLAIDNGRIVELGEGAPPERSVLPETDSILCPAFTDAHLHLPQIDSIGNDGLDLLDWLATVIFPEEMKWSDATAAKAQIARGFARLLEAGSLGFAGFLTSHPHGLGGVQLEHDHLPLRGVVGQSLMDRNGPDALIGEDVATLPPDQPRLRFSVNPRYAISCSADLLATAGRMAAAGATVQTHLAEQAGECELVRDLFPEATTYTEVYDRFGLLNERTLLAHCVHLGPREWKLISDRDCVIVHCPTANVFLRSGLFDLDAARAHEIRLALGSDVAAGPDLAMPRVARAMIEVAKVRRMTVAPSAHVPRPEDVWRLITRGNAEALGFTDAGRMTVGAAADLLVLRPPFEIDGSLVGRLLYTWRNDYITHRVVAGMVL